MTPQVIGFPVPYVAELGEPDEARAKRLQPLVAGLVARLGVPEVAARTGLSGSAVAAFAKGRVTPRGGSLDAYQEMVTAAEEESADEERHARARGIVVGGSVLVSGG